MALTPTGYDVTLTREELLRARNETVKKDTESSSDSTDCNEQESEPGTTGD